MNMISQPFSSPTTSIRKPSLPFDSVHLRAASRRSAIGAARSTSNGEETRSPPPKATTPQLPHSQQLPSLALVAGIAAASLAAAHPAVAFEIHPEPANALSLPTWAVHTSSVIEWLVGMSLMWRYGEVSGNPRWKGMTWGMLPCLGSAMCACTWHFFYNAQEIDFLVTLQAALTVLGNVTCWIAAYRIYKGAQAENA